MSDILKDFIKGYCLVQDKENLQSWLQKMLEKELPDKDSIETEKMADEIIKGISASKRRLERINKFTSNGFSASDCLEKDIEKCAALMKS